MLMCGPTLQSSIARNQALTLPWATRHIGAPVEDNSMVDAVQAVEQSDIRIAALQEAADSQARFAGPAAPHQLQSGDRLCTCTKSQP
mmetsp:Transcript_7363/g.16115  ORF Transcript_7363/g.16115 Transcript_7363/m.16115 type:complete len:87 (+) Transcript_7363:138-398(+)